MVPLYSLKIDGYDGWNLMLDAAQDFLVVAEQEGYDLTIIGKWFDRRKEYLQETIKRCCKDKKVEKFLNEYARIDAESLRTLTPFLRSEDKSSELYSGVIDYVEANISLVKMMSPVVLI